MTEANYKDKEQIKALLMKNILQASESTLEKHVFSLFEVNEVKNLVLKSLVKSYSQLINLKICKQDFYLRSKTSPTLQLQTISHS